MTKFADSPTWFVVVGNRVEEIRFPLLVEIEVATWVAVPGIAGSAPSAKRAMITVTEILEENERKSRENSHLRD